MRVAKREGCRLPAARFFFLAQSGNVKVATARCRGSKILVKMLSAWPQPAIGRVDGRDVGPEPGSFQRDALFG